MLTGAAQRTAWAGLRRDYRAVFCRRGVDGAYGVDIYGDNGISVGDYDGDWRDDVYVCKPAGLPNRLYRNRGDGTFEDVRFKCGGSGTAAQAGFNSDRTVGRIADECLRKLARKAAH